MSYFPKHYIKINQYTNGDEFVYKGTSLPYTGPYFQTGNNKFFTGNTPQSSNILELSLISTPSQIIPEGVIAIEYAYLNDLVDELGDIIPTTDDIDNIDTINYLSIKNQAGKPISFKYIPPFNLTLPTQQNYQNGEFRRYFCKKTNQSIYIEIDLETYNKLKNKSPEIEWPLYIPFNIPWQLTGNKQQVYDVNRNITLLAMKNQKLPNFDQYLKFDFTKYYNQLGTSTSGSYINGVNQGYVLDNRDGRSTGVFDSQNDSGSIRRDNSISR
jgi:hypothetical protein